ncbi:MAG: hypothetical protein WDA29_11150 [Flavobacteriaceae bacterium]
MKNNKNFNHFLDKLINNAKGIVLSPKKESDLLENFNKISEDELAIMAEFIHSTVQTMVIQHKLNNVLENSAKEEDDDLQKPKSRKLGFCTSDADDSGADEIGTEKDKKISRTTKKKESKVNNEN